MMPHLKSFLQQRVQKLWKTNLLSHKKQRSNNMIFVDSHHQMRERENIYEYDALKAMINSSEDVEVKSK